jgi:uncharacterized protein (TIGR02678 family)
MNAPGGLVEQQHADERRAAVRALLRRPLLSQRTDAAAFAHVRRHVRWLRTELYDVAGYELAVHPGGWARLRKRAIDPHDPRVLRHPPSGRWARRSTATDRWPAFDRRQYTLLALTCAVLCRGYRYVSLQRLVDAVRALAADEGLPIDLLGSDRRAYVGVILWLEHHGALEHRDGGEQALDAWREQDLDADLLWSVQAPLVADVLGAARPIDATTTVAALFDDEREYASADDRRNLRGKWRLARRLLEQSAVYVEDLDEDERAWWRSKRAWTEQRCAELTGLEVERRREGTMLVDRTAESGRALSDLRFPDNRGARRTQMALLLCAELAARLRAGEDALPRAEVLALAESHARLYAANWRLGEGDRQQALELAEEAIELLHSHRMVRDAGATLHPRPAICRFGHARPQEASARAGDPLQETLL